MKKMIVIGLIALSITLCGCDINTKVFKNENINMVENESSDELEEEKKVEIEDNHKVDNIQINSKITDIKKEENKVNIYMFWGDGCPHCEEQFKFFKSIEGEYGDFFNLYAFETWYSSENLQLLDKLSSKMGEEVRGVPYTIIGKKTFSGYSSSKGNEMIAAIKEQYQNSYDVYFDN